MFSSKEGILTFNLIVLISAAAFGGFAGYSVSGIDYSISTDLPGILGIVEWSWLSITFLFNMVTMQIDGIPYFLNAVFQFISIVTIWLIVTLIRGN